MNNNRTIYQQHGYTDRTQYFRHLAEEYSTGLNTVLQLAHLLGHREDFDGLVTALEDYTEERSY